MATDGSFVGLESAEASFRGKENSVCWVPFPCTFIYISVTPGVIDCDFWDPPYQVECRAP